MPPCQRLVSSASSEAAHARPISHARPPETASLRAAMPQSGGAALDAGEIAVALSSAPANGFSCALQPRRSRHERLAANPNAIAVACFRCKPWMTRANSPWHPAHPLPSRSAAIPLRAARLILDAPQFRNSAVAKFGVFLLNAQPRFPTNPSATNSTKARFGPKTDQTDHRPDEALGTDRVRGRGGRV